MARRCKIFFSISWILPCFGICNLSLTSCVNEPYTPPEPPITPTDQQYLDFIDARSFSIAALGNTTAGTVWVRGTGWIVNRVDTTLNDYSYWLATNWHVIDGFNSLTSAQYRYADDSINIGSWNSYSSFSSFVPEAWQNFTTDDNKSTAIDFYVAKVNFGSPTGGYKTKLDNLNTYWNNNSHHINAFRQNYQSTSPTDKKYIAGYPVAGDNPYASYEEHVIMDSSAINLSHTFPETEDVKTDTSPQYRFPEKPPNWMDHGASGSMILDMDYHVCGVYWGGWVLQGSENFLPCASIMWFNTTNYVSNYL
jgi:hypothetical protein